jgi:curved DNA-binding protein CbpA
MNIDTAFEILGLDKYMVKSIGEVNTRYRKLVLKYHPDKTGNDEKTTEIFKQIANAYQAITNDPLFPYTRPASTSYVAPPPPPASDAYAAPRSRPTPAAKNRPMFTDDAPVYPEFKPSSRYVPPKRKTNLFEKPSSASYTKRSQNNDAYGPSPAARAYLEKYGNHGFGLKHKSSRKKNTKKRKQTKKRKDRK